MDEELLRGVFAEVLEEKLRALECRLTGQLTQLAQLTLDRRRRPGLRVTRGSPELDGHTHSESLTRRSDADDRSDLCSVDTTLAFPSLLHRHDSPTVSKETQMESNVDRIPSGQSTYSKRRQRLSCGPAGELAHHEYAKSFRSSNASHEKTKMTMLQKLLRCNAMELTLAVAILASSLLVGFEVQLMSSKLDTSLPLACVIFRVVLNLLFICELLLRMYAFGCMYCGKGGTAWFWFDVFLVCGSAAEAFLDIYSFFDGSLEALPDFSQVRLLKILRVTRLLRALRLPRLMRYVAPLQTLVSSISHTFYYLLWAAVLLLLLIYTVSIAFAQTVTSFVLQEGLDEVQLSSPLLLIFWKDLWTSMSTCFMAISGGINWQTVYDPLNDLDAMMGKIFILFISFAYFALLNILTGVFCNSAMEALSRDPDIVAISQEATYIREHLCHVFNVIDKDSSGHMTLDELEVWMEEENGKVDLQALGIDEGDPWSLFKLLDENAEGVVSQVAFVDGCLRLRGNASGVDIASLRNESRATQELLSMLISRFDVMDKKPRRPSFGSRLTPQPRRHTVSLAPLRQDFTL